MTSSDKKQPFSAQSATRAFSYRPLARLRIPALLLALALLCACSSTMLTGCARAARDTTGFTLEHTTKVNAPFEETWQTVKTVLRENEFDIYTRDKRGSFIAYTDPQRKSLRFFLPKRTQYTIEVAAVSADETAIYIETVNQVYGVTLLTYPGWHDRETEDDSQALVILQAVEARLASPEAPAES